MWTQLVALSKLGEADRDQASRCSELVALLDALRRRAERLAACLTHVILVAALGRNGNWRRRVWQPIAGRLRRTQSGDCVCISGVPPFCEAGVVVRFYATAEAA